ESCLEVVSGEGSTRSFSLEGSAAELAPLRWLYFESATGATLVARWGDPKLVSPRYDLEAVRDSAATRAVVTATWGDVRDLAPPEPEALGVEGAIPSTGAEIDATRFRWRRRIPAGPTGLTALVLHAAALAHSRVL